MRSGVSPIPISNRRSWILTNLFENYLLKRLTKTTPRPPLRNRRTWFSRTFTTRSKSTDSCGEAVLTRTVQLRANMKHKVQNTRTTLLVRRTVAHLLVGGVSESLGVPCSSKHGGCWEKMLASKISIILAKTNLELELEAHTLCGGASHQFYLLANFELLTPTLSVQTRKSLVHHLHQNGRLALNSRYAYRGEPPYITLYMPEIFEIAREFDQKRYICPFISKNS